MVYNQNVLNSIHKSWHPFVLPEFEKEYMQNLKSFLEDENKNQHVIYPATGNVFKALSLNLQKVNAVFIGQDPYHGEGQAMGYSFSVPKTAKIPPSLKRIYKELAQSVDFSIPQTGDLTPWVENNGFLMLNSVLTVRANNPGSHAKKGWEQFTDKIMQIVNEQTESTIFFLLGNYAKQKGAFLDKNRHCVLQAAHPSPLARSGFVDSGIFAQADLYRKEKDLVAFDWNL